MKKNIKKQVIHNRAFSKPNIENSISSVKVFSDKSASSHNTKQKRYLDLFCILKPEYEARIDPDLADLSKINQKLSAYAQLHGQFDFRATPMAQIGANVFNHQPLSSQGSWDIHGIDEWYMGPALEHYRCYQCVSKATGKLLHLSTVEFFLTAVPIPKSTPLDQIKQAATDICNILHQPKPASPHSHFKNDTLNAIHDIVDILNRKIPPPPQPIMPTTKKRTQLPKGAASNGNPNGRITTKQSCDRTYYEQ